MPVGAWNQHPDFLILHPRRGLLEFDPALVGEPGSPFQQRLRGMFWATFRCRVMDLQREQLARSVGEGDRVIRGVAGSGKTMAGNCRMLL